MAGHLEGKAKAIATALQSKGELDNLAREFLEEIGPLDSHVHYDVGANLVLVVVPGYTPLVNPQDYVHLAPRGP